MLNSQPRSMLVLACRMLASAELSDGCCLRQSMKDLLTWQAWWQIPLGLGQLCLQIGDCLGSKGRADPGKHHNRLQACTRLKWQVQCIPVAWKSVDMAAFVFGLDERCMETTGKICKLKYAADYLQYFPCCQNAQPASSFHRQACHFMLWSCALQGQRLGFEHVLTPTSIFVNSWPAGLQHPTKLSRSQRCHFCSLGSGSGMSRPSGAPGLTGLWLLLEQLLHEIHLPVTSLFPS